jgi:hypothetical protein
MNKKLFLFIPFMLMTLVNGCAVLENIERDPKAEFQTAAIIYSAVVETLVILKSQGVFSEDEIEKIGEVLMYVDGLMNVWYQAILLEDFENIPKYQSNFEKAIEVLSEHAQQQ